MTSNGSLFPLFARVQVIHSHALLTADVTAPVENTVALLLSPFSPGVVTSAAAEQVAAIYAVRRQVADPISGAEGARLRIGVAEIGRGFIINQISLCWGLEVVVLGSQGLHPSTGLPVLLHHHLRGAVVLVLHVVSNNSEVRLRPPAGFDFTASREPVALTLQEHVTVKGLWIDKKYQQAI